MRKAIYFVFILFVVLFFISCATSPEKGAKTTKESTRKDLAGTEYEQASELRDKIELLGIAKYSPDDHKKAEKLYIEGEIAMDKDQSASNKAFKEAKVLYKAVLKKGAPEVIDRQTEETENVKQAADNIKADVAMKDDYRKAVGTYDKAVKAKAKGNYEQSVELFLEARAMFEEVYQQTVIKKTKAEKSMANSTENLKMVEEKVKSIQL